MASIIETFNDYFLNEQFDLIYQVTSEQFQRMASAQEFVDICSDYRQGMTALEKITEKPWFGATQVIWLDAATQKAIQLTYEGQTIVGFYLKELHSYPSDAVHTKNRYRLPINETWFVFWGGRNELENYHYRYESQRYAYDLVQVENGLTYEHTGEHNEHYYAFGKDVLAPCDGKIIQVVDGIEDNVPGDMNEDAPAGNYVIIAHANDEYSMIAHFKNGSIVVREGEVVEVGQLLGQCGNSGNSSEAHIHFQVMSRPHLTDTASIRIQFENGTEPVQGDFVK